VTGVVVVVVVVSVVVVAGRDAAQTSLELTPTLPLVLQSLLEQR